MTNKPKTIEEINKELFNLNELEKNWENDFYESGWHVDSLKLTDFEKDILSELTTFLPRHMDVYDWNLPYAEEMILIVRRNLAKIS